MLNKNKSGDLKEKYEIDYDKLFFENTNITEESLEAFIFRNIYLLKDDKKRKDFRIISLHNIKHIFYGGNKFFSFLEKLNLENNNILIDNKKNFEEEFNVFLELYQEYIKGILYFSKNDKDFIEKGIEIIKVYNYIKNKYTINDIIKIIVLGEEEGKKLKEKLNFLSENEELKKLDFFTIKYKKLIFNFLQNFHKLLLDIVNNFSQILDNKNKIFLENQIFSFNLIINEEFGDIFGVFDIENIINYNLFGLSEGIKVEKDIICLKIKQNLGGFFRNILLNIEEHGFGNDFNSKNKNISINGKKDKNGNYILSFQDNGRGMNKKELKNIFTEGKTIKEEQEGHGIAMYKYKKEMQDLGGDIIAESDGLGKGSIFTIIIPKNIIIENN